MQSQYKYFIYEPQGRTAVLTINRPKVFNSLSREVLMELETILDAIAKEKTLRALIITGAEKAFIAGADIAEMSAMNTDEAAEFARLGHRVFTKLEKLPCATIAAINGYALGGGLELALSCDIRIASEKAQLGQPEVGLGIIPGFGGTQRLARICGVGTAKYLIMSGRRVRAGHAAALNIVSAVVPAENLLNEATALAAEISEKSHHAVMLAKETVQRGIGLAQEEGLQLEIDMFSRCFSHNDQKEGMKAFIDQRKAEFQ